MEDILTDSSNDIMTAAGDFATGDSGEQSIRLLMNTSKGEWKENPLTEMKVVESVKGGVVGYLEQHDSNMLSSEIQTQLTRDGAKVRRIASSAANIEVEADYE